MQHAAHRAPCVVATDGALRASCTQRAPLRVRTHVRARCTMCIVWVGADAGASANLKQRQLSSCRCCTNSCCRSCPRAVHPCTSCTGHTYVCTYVHTYVCIRTAHAVRSVCIRTHSQCTRTDTQSVRVHGSAHATPRVASSRHHRDHCHARISLVALACMDAGVTVVTVGPSRPLTPHSPILIDFWGRIGAVSGGCDGDKGKGMVCSGVYGMHPPI